MTTLLVGTAVLDPLSLTDLARDGLAAATFTINIVLAWRQNDYLAADLAPSPLLHFWSLALEEQFYLVWPLLLQLVAGYRHHRRAAVALLIVVGWPISFAASVLLTGRNQPWAFFSLSTRAWELLTGAALALLVAPCPAGAGVRARGRGVGRSRRDRRRGGALRPGDAVPGTGCSRARVRHRGGHPRWAAARAGSDRCCSTCAP